MLHSFAAGSGLAPRGTGDARRIASRMMRVNVGPPRSGIVPHADPLRDGRRRGAALWRTACMTARWQRGAVASDSVVAERVVVAPEPQELGREDDAGGQGSVTLEEWIDEHSDGPQCVTRDERIELRIVADDGGG